MAIILRGTKGSELTWAEVDGNFQSLYYSSSLVGNTIEFYFSIELNFIFIEAQQ